MVVGHGQLGLIASAAAAGDLRVRLRSRSESEAEHQAGRAQRRWWRRQAGRLALNGLRLESEHGRFRRFAGRGRPRRGYLVARTEQG